MEAIVGRFGDYFCVDCVNIPCVGDAIKLRNTKFTRPNTNIPKSTLHDVLRDVLRVVRKEELS